MLIHDQHYDRLFNRYDHHRVILFRWRQLEREARDKEMRLLGELDAGPEEDRGIGGKGRRGGGGTRETRASLLHSLRYSPFPPYGLAPVGLRL